MLLEQTIKFLEGLVALGLTETERDLIVQVFHESELLGKKDWGNVPLHCLRVARVGQAIAKMIGLQDSKEIILAGLLHDVRKHIERSRAKELMANDGLKEADAFNKAAEEQASWLISYGFRPETLVMSRMSGHTSIRHFLFEERSVEEKIFHLADDLCGGAMGDEVVMLEERMKVLSQRYAFLLTDGKEELNGLTYGEGQLKVSRDILAEIAGKSGMNSGQAVNVLLVMLLSK